MDRFYNAVDKFVDAMLDPGPVRTLVLVGLTSTSIVFFLSWLARGAPFP